MLIVRFIEYCGKHPFATGLFALLSVVGMVFSFYAFSVDQAAASSSSDQATRIEQSIDGLRLSLDQRAEPKVPVIFGMSYPEARQQLIKDGWNPKMHHYSVLREMGSYNGNSDTLWEAGFRENDLCYPTGEGQCRFIFYDAESNLLVVTTGGEAQPNGTPDNFRHVRVQNVYLNPENLSDLKPIRQND